MALILALGAVGVGYAMWWEDLYIDGYVEMGYLDVEWSCHTVTIDGDPKAYSSAYCDPAGDTLWIDIYNAFPCVTYIIEYDVHNIGTIPVHVSLGTPYGDIPPGAVTITGPGSPDDHYQIHPGEEGIGYITVHLTNAMLEDYFGVYDGSAGENAQFSFYLDLRAYNYNEDL
jgi:hypothetical protein